MTTERTQDDPDSQTLRTQRVLPFPPEVVFDAFRQPELLAQWWGPNGFTNTFDVFEFAEGGSWKFAMHGPNGSHHPNESVFLEIATPSRIVIDHVSIPRFVLTVALAPHEAGSAITWDQRFEHPDIVASVRNFAEPANEQNLDRLTAVLEAQRAASASPRS